VRPRRSRARTITIVLVLIALTSLTFAAIKLFVLKRSSAASSEGRADSGTIMVTIAGSGTAQVLINGENKGTVETRHEFTLELPPRDYEVQVKPTAGAVCRRVVELKAKSIELVNCDFSEGAKPALLIIEGLKDDYRLFVDEEEVAAASAREPLKLAPGLPHTVVVKRGEEVLTRFEVTPEAGEEVHRKVGDAPGPGSTAPVAPNADKRTQAETPARPSEGASDAAPAAVALSSGVDQGEKRRQREVGWLVVYTRPEGLKVAVDNVDTGRVTPIHPGNRLELEAGRHHIAFEVEGTRYTYPITIEPGKVKEVVRQLPVRE
jgi:hypothetical protein